MNINTDIDDFHIFFPLRLMGLGDSQNRKMAIQQTVRNAHFSGVWPHRMCLLISKSLRYGKHRFSAGPTTYGNWWVKYPSVFQYSFIKDTG